MSVGDIRDNLMSESMALKGIERPTVIAVVPTLGSDIPRLQRLLQSLRRSNSIKDLKIIIVNNSRSQSLGILDKFARVITPGMNLGWVGAIELVRREMPCEFIWTLQDDMTIINDVGKLLLDLLHDRLDLAAASPVLVKGGVVPARSRGGKMIDAVVPVWDLVPENDTDPSEIGVRDDLCFVGGSGAMWRSSALAAVNGFDLNLYPIGLADVDVCLRLVKSGWHLALNGQARITHHVQASTSPALVRFMNDRNFPIVLANFQKGGDLAATPNQHFGEETLRKIGSQATYLFLELAEWASERLKERDAAIAERDAITNSRLWRYTKPIRRLRGL